MRFIIVVTLLLVALFLGGYFWNARPRRADLEYNQQAFKHEFVVIKAHQLIGFNLLDPEQAPAEVRESVLRGYQLMMHTNYYAPDYAENELSCSNCHFVGGDTLGGLNGGISLVGVTSNYPQYSKRAGRTITLAERITNCFQRSMNGKAPSLNSKVMEDLLNYLQWISKEVETLKSPPWLGLPEIKNSHVPDPAKGQQLYENYCAACHRSDGEGGGELDEIEGKTIPPLWGANSFNDGAGMSTMGMLAPFILLNMPYQQACLTEEQALDIAAYVIAQKRPKFHPSR